MSRYAVKTKKKQKQYSKLRATWMHGWQWLLPRDQAVACCCASLCANAAAAWAWACPGDALNGDFAAGDGDLADGALRFAYDITSNRQEKLTAQKNRS